MRNILKIIPLFIIGFLLFFAMPTSAAGLVPCSGPNCNLCSFLQLISNVVRFIVVDITAPLAGLLFLIGGIMMAAAAGSEERFKKGKKIIIDTAVGVAIVLLSWLVVNALITTFASGRVPGFVAEEWWSPRCR